MLAKCFCWFSASSILLLVEVDQLTTQIRFAVSVLKGKYRIVCLCGSDDVVYAVCVVCVCSVTFRDTRHAPIWSSGMEVPSKSTHWLSCKPSNDTLSCVAMAGFDRYLSWCCWCWCEFDTALFCALAHQLIITVHRWLLQPLYGPLSGTAWVSWYQKKHSPTNHPDHHPVFISFFHLPRSIASSLFKLRAWQSFCTTSLHVLFGLPLGLEPSTSYSIHFFTQSVSSFCNTCPYHRNLFCYSINIISPIPSLSLNSLLGTLTSLTLSLHIHLTILISAR